MHGRGVEILHLFITYHQKGKKGADPPNNSSETKKEANPPDLATKAKGTGMTATSLPLARWPSFLVHLSANTQGAEKSVATIRRNQKVPR